MSTSLSHVAPAGALAHPHAWLDRRLYPFASRHFEIEGQRLHYVDEGTGSPVLFVHGTPSWSFEWRAQIEALRGRHRCIALDHLGFGLSDKPAGAAYGPADHARRLLAFVESLDLRDVTLVVHDFGGPIGLWVAEQAPARFHRVVLVNTWMWSLADDPRARRLSRLVASPLGRFLYRVLNASPRWLLPSTFADRRRLTPHVHRHYVAPFAGGSRTRVAPWALGCALWGASAFYDGVWQGRDALPEVAGIVWGMRDPTFGARELTRLREAFPAAPVHALDEAGHFPQEEAPAAVTRALELALAGPSRGSEQID